MPDVSPDVVRRKADVWPVGAAESAERRGEQQASIAKDGRHRSAFAKQERKEVRFAAG
jgi:hypothetical protein